MSIQSKRYFVSSAVIVVRADKTDATVEHLSKMPGVGVHGVQDRKIVVVIEGGSSGELGASLAEISGLDGVVAANMVFEHSEDEEVICDDRRIHTA
ncbi:chaperone NapD [Rhizobium terrae]|uniref:chaperone NapD n=1 Tax=Rhizobium terrae TaxID=2171756 RepID=UPI000E3C1B9A|nr:chaperone NapD [Rhizobium terrae]